MTEKRFTTDYYNFVRDDKTYIKDNDVRMTYEQIVDLLNNYSEENEQLKQQVKQYSIMVNVNRDLNYEIYEQLKKTEKSYKLVLEENEQLKQSLERKQRRIDAYEDYIKTLKEDGVLE